MKTTHQDPTKVPAPDLVKRDFTADGLNKLLVGDITYIPTDEGFCFLATVLDVHSRRLVGWSLQAHMRTSLCTDALLAAAGLRGRDLAGRHLRLRQGLPVHLRGVRRSMRTARHNPVNGLCRRFLR
jgi:transposase InsO family protein